MVTNIVKTHEAGESVMLWAYVTSKSSGAYVDPSAGVTVSLRKPDGNPGIAVNDVTEITDEAMTKDETGKYYYNYRSRSTDPLGEWKFWCVATDGAGDTATITTGRHKFMLQSPQEFS